MEETIQEFIQDTKNLRLKDVKVTQGLTRKERLQYRNEKILQDLAVGKSRQSLAEEYRITESMLSRIVTSAEEEAQDWYRELTKQHAIALHNINLKKYLQCIIDLENRRKTIDPEDDRLYKEYTEGIAKLRKDYDSLIADGALFRKVKDLEEMIEE
ncbi:transcription regulator [Nitrososphaeria virus YSH_1032793]|uniref:Transcription regulator n=1 Tax=Nitrososphaeria virus YSH_1032793 TaxID=3071320 RepID=A0A976UAE1_9CAUD|nr:transcription regulator [Yangshan Harbor Nitrososphaeria virus]UVF62254.1 transcription regulator [Nitrososphaeria virus YSH_1032793]